MYRALVVPEKGGRWDFLVNPEVLNTEHRDESFEDEVTEPTLPGKASKHQITRTVP